MVVWSISVRVFHWLNAALFLCAYWLLEAGEKLHEWAGYAVAALVVLRIALGVFGKGHARFSDFMPTPGRVYRYLRDFPASHAAWPGHNPVGGLMILFMLGVLLLVSVTGWLQTTAKYWGEEWVQQLHEYAADLMMLTVVVHVVAVLWMQWITGVPLVRAMMTGKRH